MREIKFRGKTLSGKWVYGDLVHLTNTQGIDGSIIITEHQATAESDDFDYALCYARNEFEVVIPDTVGQFTVHHDKNGKEIYEGDIIIEKLRRARKDGERLVICFDDFEYQGKNANGATTSLSLLLEYHTIEVIGNIHDNPELLITE